MSLLSTSVSKRLNSTSTLQAFPIQISKLVASAFLLLATVAGSTAQAQAPVDSLKNQFQRYALHGLHEKVFLHVDRPTYLCGEVLWFKVYAVDGTYHKPLPMSKVAYVEVLDKAQRPVMQSKIPLQQAMGQGSFLLPPSLASGTYTVRAYTSWMKNFSPDFYYQTSITVLNPAAASSQSTAKDTLAYDIQFFPEGGNLVRSINSKVGFKIADRKGRSLDAEGTVQNEKGAVVARFRTLKFGLGSFSFTPELSGTTYTASVKLPNGRLLTRRLPAVAEQGMVLHVEEGTADELNIHISAMGTGQTLEPVYLLGHARQKVTVAATATLNNGQAVFQVKKQDLPDGISHFTLFNSRQQPVCERLYFRRPAHLLRITATTDKTQYSTRDKVRLQLGTATSSMPLAPANLSVAVFRQDSLGTTPSTDILSYLWLTSDIKGTIENPSYYLTSSDTDARQAADNLMLTQGWSRFRWEEVQTGKAPVFEFLPEMNGHLIRGRMVNSTTGAPVPNVHAYLTSPNRQGRLFSAVSRPDGTLLFEVKDFFGAKDIVVQPNHLMDSTSRVEILNPYSVAYSKAGPLLAPLPLTVRYKDAITQRYLQTQLQKVYFKRYNNQYTFPALDTLQYVGKPDEHYNLDDFIRFPTMEDIMREYVPGVALRRRKDGFHFLVINEPLKTVFVSNPLVLLDGVPVFNINKIMAFDPLKVQKLDVFTRHYFVGQLMFDGLVSYTTYKGDLAGFPLSSNVLMQEYEGLQYHREFYAPSFETTQDQASRLPDFRTLLYWNPNVTTSSAGNKPLEFYTSDQAGKYTVVIQGLATDGSAGHASFDIEVKPTPKS
ncbi:hypothetical protein [Hymenobacter sp. DG25A]|uniref:hypothetical protein n=1 Tax=Hymenobacter sp. DG25A TaxID=1385663 RepID=UPI0006C86E86|nr:hypothetical protein [Hymenobacter sp. DG25A]